MHIGILGTGMVGASIGTKLVTLGHSVKMGARAPRNEKAAAWAAAAGPRATFGTFADAAAASAEMVFNCTSGIGSLEALQAAGRENLAGKILVDVANALDFSRGMPPTLAVCNVDSLGEQIQRAFPDAQVVKALNTMNCELMVNPTLVPGEHDVFICGNDAAAKGRVAALLREEIGWRSVVDLGDITAARGMEMVLPLWLRLYGAMKSPMFNFHIQRPRP